MKPPKLFPQYPTGCPAQDARLGHLETIVQDHHEALADLHDRVEALQEPQGEPDKAKPSDHLPLLPLGGMAVLGLLAATGNVSPELLRQLILALAGKH